MDARHYYQTTPTEQVKAMCERAGTNIAYFRQIAYGHRRPSPKLARRFHQASNGQLELHLLRPDIWLPSEKAAA